MKIHYKQYFSAIKHIKDFWDKGCKCVLCTSVDNKEDFKK